MTVTINGSTGITSPDTLTINSNNISAVNSLGFRNRIINGDMRIDQRNAGASVTPTAGTYTVDRWEFYITQASKVAFQQNAGGVTPPAGFKNYLGFTVGASANVTVGASDLFLVDQFIEGYNIADLGFGASGASSVTLSFRVYSSLTGTFGGALTNSGNGRSYPFTYTISAANTWEQKTLTIAGDTSGTWNSTNGTGLGVRFSLGCGSTYLGTAGSWASTSYFGATGQTQLVQTNGATWYITGVQLEAGSVASPFERVDYGQQLIQCQRYYQTAGSASTGSADGSTTTIQITEKMFTPMRSAPTGAIYSGVTASFRSVAADFNNASPALANFAAGGGNSFWTQVTGFTGLTSNAVVTGRNSQTANGGNFIALSAEL